MKTSEAYNCVVCFYRFVFDPFRPLFPIKGYCQHSKYYNSTRPKFEISRLICAGLFVFSTGLLLFAFSFVSYLPQLFQNNRSLCLMVTADKVLILSTGIVCLRACLSLDTVLQETRSWLCIYEMRKSFGLKEIIDEKLHKKLKSYQIVTIVAITFLITVMAPIRYIFINDDLPWNPARNFLIAFSTGFQNYLALEYCQKMVLIGSIVKAIKASLESASGSSGLENIFARASRLVLFIHRNLELLKKYTNNIFPVWVLTMTINLILNIYFLVKYSDYNIYALSMLQVRTITLILYLWTMLYFHDMQLIDPVSKLSVLCCPQKKRPMLVTLF
jgi:hypothetical protein